MPVVAAPPPMDRDLLIRVDTKLDLLTVSVHELKANVALKADLERVTRLEDEVGSLKAKVTAAAGGLAALEFILQFWLHYRH